MPQRWQGWKPIKPVNKRKRQSYSHTYVLQHDIIAVIKEIADNVRDILTNTKEIADTIRKLKEIAYNLETKSDSRSNATQEAQWKA